MSEKTPYEHNELNRQFHDLPLPDENRSWEKMEAMLDEDDRKRGIIPLFFKYGVWMLLALITAGGAWFLLKDKEVKEAVPAVVIQKDNKPSTQEESNKLSTTVDVNEAASNNEPGSDALKNEDSKKDIDKNSQHQKALPVANNHANKNKPVVTTNTINNQSPVSANSSMAGKNEKITSNKTGKEKDNAIATGASATGLNNALASSNKPVQDEALQNAGQDDIKTSSVTELQTAKQSDVETVAETVSLNTTTSISKDDSSISQTKTGLMTDSSDTSTKNIPQNSISKRFIVSAGLGEQQQIPVAGQSSARYNDNGNSGILKDYIPSVYVQVQKGKWFLNASFKYAGAQYVTQNNFYQQTRFESATKTLVQQSSSVQKIYYHQLPISLNYEILPNWSVGAGGMFNWLHSTVIENKTSVTDVVTNNSISETMQVRAVKAFTDSFFYASPFNVFLQTEYRFNRLSLGVRYAWGVAPYMKYTMPDGTVQTQTSQSLQFILRYRLWETSINRRNKLVFKTPD